jgi:ABC-type transporter Mla subunit MlaD
VRLIGITKPGMIALTLAVLALWTCFASERITTGHARNELRASLRRIQLLRRQAPVRVRATPV